MNYFLSLAFILGAFVSFGQQFTISGTVKDARNGEDLFGAVIKVKELSNVGAKTNAYGFYSLTLDAGTYTLLYRSTGLDDLEKVVELKENMTLNIELSVPEDVQLIEEVQVKAVKENENITSSEMNVTKFDPKDIETIPVIFGEKDIMKTLQLTPGVKTAGEGNSGFYVRGGGADQNLVLLDEATVYNASHLLGFFSVFNSDAVKDVSLYKSGVPSEFGGRASSVMDVKMKDGNLKKFGVSGGIGLISSRLAIEGPIVKDKGSFIISGRRSYLDLFLKLSKDKDIQKTKLYFYDLNMKANYKLSDKDRIFVSGYFGRDDFGFSDQFGFDWGNATGTVRYNRIISDKLFSNTSVVFSNFNYRFTIGSGDDSFGVNSSIQDWSLKQDFSLYANKNNTVKFGLIGMHHTFKPGALTGGNSSFNEIVLDSRYAVEVGAYIQNDQKIGNRFNLMYGLRYSGFDLVGGKFYSYDQEGTQLSSDSVSRWETIKYHQGLEPRISMSYILSEKNSIKLGYNRMFQYMHQLSNTTTSSPTDVWVPSSNNILPQIADQVALGYYQNIKNNTYRISTEIYYKALQNQIDYRNGANLILNNEVEGELVYGQGKAYGIELMLEKKKGKLTGWIGYTLSRSLRQFDQINEGKEFSARQDRIHDLSVVLMYKLTPNLALASTFVYPDYHRMDVGLTYYMKDKKRFEHSLNFSVYNVYARENAFTITFEENEETGKTEAIRTALFKIVPSITYNFKLK